tara:strand:+ start:100 stop:588 length:489 start_codon:yes stop_codon:yes gene_type:complete
MKNFILSKIIKIPYILLFSCIFCGNTLVFAQEKRIIHSLPINKELNQSDKFSNNLIPMPEGNIKKSSTKVNFDRNPFQEPLEREFPLIQNLYSSLRLKGLAKARDKIFAIIETDNEQKFYKVGDKLKNGFIIQFISLENVTVDISNGSKNFRMKLTDFKKMI